MAAAKFDPWVSADVTTPITRPCGYCGGQMTGRRDKQYCSASCRADAHRARRPAPAFGLTVCYWCSATFLPLRRKDALYCTDRCRQVACRSSWRETVEQLKTATPGPEMSHEDVQAALARLRAYNDKIKELEALKAAGPFGAPGQ